MASVMNLTTVLFLISVLSPSSRIKYSSDVMVAFLPEISCFLPSTSMIRLLSCDVIIVSLIFFAWLRVVDT